MKLTASVIVAFVGLASSALAQGPATDPIAEPGSPQLSGRSLFDDRCSSCHSTGRVTIYRRTRAQWSDTVRAMADKGLDLTDREAAQIVDYLTAALPPIEDSAPAAPDSGAESQGSPGPGP